MEAEGAEASRGVVDAAVMAYMGQARAARGS
jgi:hypothetical protein